MSAIQLLIGELEQTCNADPRGVPCPTCGKSSIMHAFKQLRTLDARGACSPSIEQAKEESIKTQSIRDARTGVNHELVSLCLVCSGKKNADAELMAGFDAALDALILAVRAASDADPLAQQIAAKEAEIERLKQDVIILPATCEHCEGPLTCDAKTREALAGERHLVAQLLDRAEAAEAQLLALQQQIISPKDREQALFEAFSAPTARSGPSSRQRLDNARRLLHLDDHPNGTSGGDLAGSGDSRT